MYYYCYFCYRDQVKSKKQQKKESKDAAKAEKRKSAAAVSHSLSFFKLSFKHFTICVISHPLYTNLQIKTS